MKELIFNTPLFGVTLTLFAFAFGQYVFKKTQTPVLNPMIVSQVTVILFLYIFDIKTESYFLGGRMLEFFMSPVTVILAVPLYRNLEILKQHFVPVLFGAFCGSIAAIVSVIGFGKLLGLEELLLLSFIPKSVTTPIGLEVVNMLGGIPAITAVCITITGVIGNVSAPYICKFFRIHHPVAVGMGIGVSSHAFGTAKAMEMGELEGAMSSLSIAVAGLMTLFIAPLFKNFLV